MKPYKQQGPRDRNATENALLDAVGSLIAEEGFEALGVNAIAARAGISKMLIYRYFDSLEGIIAAYIRRSDFWINFEPTLPAREHLTPFLKTMFRDQIERLRSDDTLRRLCRWELSASNALVSRLRDEREAKGLWIVDAVSRLTGCPQPETAALATLLSAAVSYLALLEDSGCEAYNGIPLQRDEGWEQLARGIDTLIDLWIANLKKQTEK